MMWSKHYTSTLLRIFPASLLLLVLLLLEDERAMQIIVVPVLCLQLVTRLVIGSFKVPKFNHNLSVFLLVSGGRLDVVEIFLFLLGTTCISTFLFDLILFKVDSDGPLQDD